MGASLSPKKNPSDRRIQEFKRIADEVCAIASEHDVKLLGYHNPELPFYNALSAEKQDEILRQLEVFLQTMKAALASGDRLDNMDRSLWHALVTLGMIPPSEMFSRVTTDAVIEIYDTQGIQIWRNFNFLKICSYTLEEMHCLEWYNRYEREIGKTDEILRAVNDLFSGKVPEIHFAGVGEHHLTEKCSVNRLVLRARHDWFVLLKDRSSQACGFVVFSGVEIIDSPASAGPTDPAARP